MTRRAFDAQRLAPAALVLVTALACGNSHEESGDPNGSGGTSSGGFGARPSQPGPGGRPSVGTGGATSPGGAPQMGTGGFAVSGSFGVAGFGATGGVATGGTGPNAGAAGAAGAKNPPGSCPAQPPPNGTSCADYFADADHHCFYDAPACRVVATCGAGEKWSSGCELVGEAGAPSQAGGAGGAGGAEN